MYKENIYLFIDLNLNIKLKNIIILNLLFFSNNCTYSMIVYKKSFYNKKIKNAKFDNFLLFNFLLFNHSNLK